MPKKSRNNTDAPPAARQPAAVALDGAACGQYNTKDYARTRAAVCASSCSAQNTVLNNATSPSPKVPVPTLERLATYLRTLIALETSGIETVSSTDIEKQTGINAAQFRKDLSYFGEFGKPGVGYNVEELQGRIARILKIDRHQAIMVIGAGNLGSALIGYPGLGEHKFHIAAVFDNDPAKIGRLHGTLPIHAEADMGTVNRSVQARIAILCVPARAAQHVANEAIAAGVSVILNFAPVILKVPGRVTVRNVSFLQELAVLSYHLSGEPAK